jgi:hypothetical protein
VRRSDCESVAPYRRLVRRQVDVGCYHPTKNLRIVACPLEFYHGRAMTRIGYVKPQMFETSSRHSQRPPNNGFPSLKLFSFGLQSITRHVLPLSPGWEPGTSLGFGPFSAIITGRDDTRLPVSSLPVHRFSQPLNRSFVPHDSWVYSTPQALLGS